jgi:toxin YhaV
LKETSASDEPLVINGWQVFAHPLLVDQLARLIQGVEAEKRKSPDTYRSAASAKVLAALSKLLFITIPADPGRPEYRQGSTLGEGNKHWFRAKFGGQRFRLFFRYSSSAKIIIYAWVNDSQTLRTYGSKTDAYAVFAAMLENGNPPGSFDELLAAARAGAASLKRMRDDASRP